MIIGGRLDRAPTGIAWGVLCAVGLMLGGCGGNNAASGGNVAQSSTANEHAVAAPSPAAVPSPEAESPSPTMLQSAFRAVFDADSPVIQAADMGSAAPETTAEKLVWLDKIAGTKQALVTSTYLPGVAQQTSGYLSIYYLEWEDGDFIVKGKWPEAMSGYPHGGAPEAVSITDWFGPAPTIYAEGASSGQGYDCTYFELTELRRDAPKSVALVRLSYSNEGAVESGATIIDGKIVAIVPGKSFTIRYTGSRNFTETWTRKGGRYVLPHETRMKTC